MCGSIYGQIIAIKVRIPKINKINENFSELNLLAI
jgi:hypothetical protein